MDKLNIKKYSEQELFAQGLKPAYLGPIMEAFQEYPHCREIISNRGRVISTKQTAKKNDDGTRELIKEKVAPYCHLGNMIYFQNETLKKDYIERSKEIKKGYNKMYNLGITLGYPPSACEHLSYGKYKLNGEKMPNTAIIFNGLTFTTDATLVADNLEWLLKNYQLEKDSDYRVIVIYRYTQKAIRIRNKNDLKPNNIQKTIISWLKEDKETA